MRTLQFGDKGEDIDNRPLPLMRWKEWHVDAARSSGIQKNMETFDFGLDDKPNLRDYYDYHLPFYEKLFQYRITAG